jgi:hypothetical protein
MQGFLKRGVELKVDVVEYAGSLPSTLTSDKIRRIITAIAHNLPLNYPEVSE